MLWCEFARAAAVGAVEGARRGVGSVWGGAGEKERVFGESAQRNKDCSTLLCDS